MEQVPIIKIWGHARPYLENLKKTVEADICPLLATPDGAPFAVSREVLSYVDHLGHLYSGEPVVKIRSREYLQKIMSAIDPNYGRRAGEIYEIYRCGPVHQFAPKLLKNSKGQSLGWLCYKGKRHDQILIRERQVVVTHLEPVLSAGDLFWLPVSIVCLVDDLEASIEKFIQAGPEADRVAAWNRAAQRLNRQDISEFTIP